MNDMSAVIIPKSDQINADDLIAGPMTIRVREVRVSPGTEQPVSIVFDGSDKFFRPCKSMSRVLVAVWGPDSSQYVGKSMTLYRDPKVKWGGMEIGGIRISHMTGLDAPRVMALTESKANRKPFTVKPLIAEVEAINVNTVRAWLDECETLDDLKRTWSMKSVAPFRDQLQAHLDKRKAELAELEQGRTDSDHSEPASPTDAAEIIERMNRATLTADYLSANRDWLAIMDQMPDEVQIAVGAAKADAVARLGIKA